MTDNSHGENTIPNLSGVSILSCQVPLSQQELRGIISSDRPLTYTAALARQGHERTEHLFVLQRNISYFRYRHLLYYSPKRKLTLF